MTTNMIPPSGNEGFGSRIRTVLRRTGDPRADVMLDDFSLAPDAALRPDLAREIHERLGAASAEYPNHVPALAHAAMEFALNALGEDSDGDLAEELYEIFTEAECRRASELAEAALAIAEEDLDNGMPLSDTAEHLGRSCNASLDDILGRLAPFATRTDDIDGNELMRAAARGRSLRDTCRYEANSALAQGLECGVPFDTYEVDTDQWTPSPPAYASAVADREWEARDQADEIVLCAAEDDIQATRPDRNALLAITRRTARDTLAGVNDVKARIVAAGGFMNKPEVARAVEISIEAAREGRDKPFDDAAIAARVESIIALHALPEPFVAPWPQQIRAGAVSESPLPCRDDDTPTLPPAAMREAEMEALTHVPGLVGELVDWFCATSRTPNRTLAFAAALVFVGTIAGRVYKSPTGLRTNLYALGLAPSGFGKDAARKCIDSLATEGGLGEWIAGDGIASGSGMRKRVEQHPAIMWKIDEFGGFMKKIGDPRASHFTKQIRDNLLTYFGSAGSVFRGEDYAGERAVPCHHPNVGIYGTSTPVDFWGACGSLSVGDGLLARFMVFSVGSNTKRPKPMAASESYEEPPAALVLRCKAVARSKFGGNLEQLMDGSRPSRPYAVAYGNGAEEAVEGMSESFADRADRADREEEPFWHRAVENAVKVALVLAIGEDPDRPVITVENVRVGRRVAELCIESTLQEIKGRLADNDRQREHVDVRRWIEEAGPRGLSRTELARKVNGRFDARRRDDIVRTLEEDEKVIVTVLGEGRTGARGARYIARKFREVAE